MSTEWRHGPAKSQPYFGNPNRRRHFSWQTRSVVEHFSQWVTSQIVKFCNLSVHTVWHIFTAIVLKHEHVSYSNVMCIFRLWGSNLDVKNHWNFLNPIMMQVNKKLYSSNQINCSIHLFCRMEQLRSGRWTSTWSRSGSVSSGSTSFRRKCSSKHISFRVGER